MTEPSVQLTRVAPGRIQVKGALAFATVRDGLEQSERLFPGEQALEVDLSQVSSADSAGLSLLIEWYRRAYAQQRTLRFAGAPPQLRALAKISEIDGLLPFDGA
jgi:phospholipid transport system transporter-binding protein